MWDRIKDWIGDVITEPKPRSIVCIIVGLVAGGWLILQEPMYVSTAKTLSLIMQICGGVALVSLLWLLIEDVWGRKAPKLIAMALCLVLLIGGFTVHSDVKYLKQPVPESSYGSNISFTGTNRVACRFCVSGRCRECTLGLYDHGKYVSKCIVCNGSGHCDKCGGDGWI